MKQPDIEVIDIGGNPITVRIYTETRYNSRVSIGKSGVNIRVPSFLTSTQRKVQVEHFKDWAVRKIEKRPELHQIPKRKEYIDGEHFTIRDSTYLLKINERDTKNSSVKVVGNIVQLNLSKLLEGTEKQMTLSKLLSKAMALEFQNLVYARLQALNQLYIRKPINKLRLKYTQSVWGSCSRKGNINISTRLLFAPDEVLDYVLLHELAHLQEQNHSHRFWAIVEKAMPDYKNHEKWLKTHGKDCDY